MAYKITGGSVIGRDHEMKSTNCQDAFNTYVHQRGTIGVICDGCGSHPFSEVGANIGAQIIRRVFADYFLTNISGHPSQDIFWGGNYHIIIDKIKQALHQMCSYRDQNITNVIFDYFLFTAVGFIQDEDDIWFFSVGDGVVIVNDEIINLGPFKDNRPPYMAYALPDIKQKTFTWDDLKFKVQHYKTSEVESFLVGSDGVQDLIDKEKNSIPGKPDELVGHISQFWSEDKYFDNPTTLTRRLRNINGGIMRSNIQEGTMWKFKGILPDDTTLIVGKRIEEPVIPADEEVFIG